MSPSAPNPAADAPSGTPHAVAVIIPAKDEEDRIAATVASAKRIPGADLVLVVDDGSSDDTGVHARAAGAEVVTHRTNKGKAQAMMTGSFAVRNREISELAPGEQVRHRALLFIDGDLEDSAENTAPLAGPVLAGEADATIAILPAQKRAGGGFGFVVGLAKRGIERLSGFQATQPLSGMRCMTREAFTATQPFARGWGVETGMTIDLVWAGMRVREVECDLQHRVTGRDLKAQLHRAAQYRDVARALAVRELRGRVSGGRRPGRDAGGALS
ncbi:glycosyltransferase family 2 protein [Brevibacterium jeotgali]|uniref:Glucosyl-3-phosphoglycerate synthase n=1 Tax=Brevibacterium jeotgali TaxID=1262550 RepID=A0A2H1L531_9MICO|nr:glycosyltransferase family 2 protein [Brevibacterium jeotgali]TWB98540.1 glycosyl transferase family 2 [Brevibacterium jeotgali]SMY12007.1 Glycosyl transferase family 2 [Brevibacterium jeotgali]